MNYWQKRQRQLNSSLEKDEEALKRRLSRIYDSEARKLENQIAAYYQQYGKDNVIQYRTLLETLPDADRRLLIEQMDKFAEKYPQYRDLMPVRESIYKLNRLEGLQHSVRLQQLEIGAINNDQIRAHLERQAMRGVNAAAEAMGFGRNFYASDPDIVRRFVDVPWADGVNFSTRIWRNTDKLANYLNTDIAQGFARGEPYQRLVDQLRDRFLRVSRNDAYRLIYTEGTYVMAEATMQPFVNDFGEYRLSTVGDGKVCDICRGVSTQVFKIKDRQPGTNFPPLHTWCRCTFEIVVADWNKWMADYEARHGNGQAGKVAERMAGGEVSLVTKMFAKDAGSAIIELSRKSDNSREGFKFISDETFNNLTIAARKKGAVIIRGTKEAEEHLEKQGASASNIGDVLVFRKDVCISEVLEETHHFEQNLVKLNNDKTEPLRSILNEIDAKQYLLRVADKFKIPRNEVEQTKRQLQSYQQQLEEYQKGVK